MAILSGETKIESDNKEWGLYKLLNDESADETTSSAVLIENARAVTLFIETNGTVSGGVAKLETSVTEAGPYFVAGSVTTAAGSTGYAVSLGGDDDGFPARYARCRIETAIAGGGSIDAYIVIQK